MIELIESVENAAKHLTALAFGLRSQIGPECLTDLKGAIPAALERARAALEKARAELAKVK